MKRVKYPGRTAFLRKSVGLQPEKVLVRVTARDKAYRQLQCDRDCLYCKMLVVESIENFKEKHDIDTNTTRCDDLPG